MKFLFETWRQYIKEGDVIDISSFLPQAPEIDRGPSEEDQESLSLVIKIEDMAGNRLTELHGGEESVPIEKINALEKIIDDLGELLKK